MKTYRLLADLWSEMNEDYTRVSVSYIYEADTQEEAEAKAEALLSDYRVTFLIVSRVNLRSTPEELGEWYLHECRKVTAEVVSQLSEVIQKRIYPLNA